MRHSIVMHSQNTLVTSLLKSVTNTLKSTENTLKEREIYQLALYASSDQLTNQNKPLLHVSLAFLLYCACYLTHEQQVG